ncbi:hypothetical protein [Nocardioides sp.]|uniref:hypothetical protein n=1 Tax=Nocardioides sp. TaxID=35761 RepID=UPI003D0B3E0C
MPTPGDRDQLVRTEISVPAGVPDVGVALMTGVAVGFGLASVVVEVVLRALAQASPVPSRPGTSSVVSDRAMGLAWGVAGLTGRALQLSGRALRPVMGMVLEPPLVPRRLHALHGLEVLAQRWRADRPETVAALERWSNAALAGALSETLVRLDLRHQVDTVLRSVDADAVVAQVVADLDLDAVSAQVLATLDLDRLIATVLAGLDVDAVAEEALTAVDLEGLVTSTLSKLDLAAVIVAQVDLERIVMSALARLDLTRIVLDQVDLIGVAEYVVDGIDLPEIIRDSTGSVASEAVRGLRMQGVDADAAVARMVDRMLLRRRGRRTDVPALDDGDQAGPP